MLVALILAPSAVAGPMIVAEAVTTPISLGDDPTAELGTGFGLRAGLPVDLILLELVPEIGATAWGLDNDAPTVVLEAGGRFNIGKIVEPGVYGHILYRMRNPIVGWDAGLSLDVTVLPVIDFGAQAGVMRFEGSPALTAGIHAGIKL